jgi:hypothetical protein
MQIGDRMEWHKVVSNYGHEIIIHVTIKKIGKRVTVEVPLKNGGTRIVAVRSEHLYPIRGEAC